MVWGKKIEKFAEPVPQKRKYAELCGICRVLRKWETEIWGNFGNFAEAFGTFLQV